MLSWYKEHTTIMTPCIMVAQRWHQYEIIPSGGQKMLSGKFFRVIIISFVGVVVKSTQQGWNESIRYPYVREKKTSSDIYDLYGAARDAD